MPIWLVILIISLCYLVILIAIVGAVVIKAETRINKYKTMVEIAQKKEKTANEIINAYGTREIRIGSDE